MRGSQSDHDIISDSSHQGLDSEMHRRKIQTDRNFLRAPVEFTSGIGCRRRCIRAGRRLTVPKKEKSMRSTRRSIGRLARLLPFALALARLSSGAEDASRQTRARDPLFLTATNGAANYLAVVNTRTGEVNYVATGGIGNASGNAGAVAVSGRMAAVVNYGSATITIFTRRGDTMSPMQTIKTASQPVSVTFGHDHLVVLGLTTAESFAVSGNSIASTADGIVNLTRSDKSAAQIVAFEGGVMYSEKSGSVALLDLATNGVGTGLTGPNRSVELPATPNNDTPFGMVARGRNVYLTIAHSDRQALINNGRVASVATSGQPYKDSAGNFLHAPCWNALWGQFLYSADSPGRQLIRYLVSDSNVFYDKPTVARFSGSPTDLTVDGNMLGVIDGGDGTSSNVSLFDIDSEGELTLHFAVRVPAAINGAAIIR